MNAEQKRNLGITTIVVGVVMSIALVWFGASVWGEADTKALGSGMMNAAVEMSEIESVGGTTMEESFYQHYGTYLSGETKVNNAQLRTNGWYANILATIGLAITSSMILAGSYMVLSNKKK